MPLAERLGVPTEQIARVDCLAGPHLGAPEDLIKQAFETGATDPDAAQMMLAASILSQAQKTVEGRLSAALSLLARLVAKADPRKTLGPDGAVARQEFMPNGWRYTLSSWPRLRYAWREGLRDLLDVRPEDEATADALDEVTRMSPAEPEPVSVAIQESWPQPRVAFGVAFAGLAVSGYTLWRNLHEADRPVKRRRKRKH